MAPRRSPRTPRAFSLVELLVAMAITLALVGLVLQMVNLSSRQWKGTSDHVRAFQSARVAFETITRTLGQATLATEYDYYDATFRSRQEVLAGGGGTAAADPFAPSTYGRFSGLHFISGKALVSGQHTHALFFQTLLDFEVPASSLPSGRLNAVGFFIRYGDDLADRPENVPASLVAPRERFRLLMYCQPTSSLDVYRLPGGTEWFADDVNAASPVNLRLLAENVVLLCILPMEPDAAADSLAPGYEYDSRMAWTGGEQPAPMHQLPPVVRVAMVAIDEASALRHPGLGAELAAWFAQRELFRDPQKLTGTPEAPGDLTVLENELARRRIVCRVFQADVPIRSAKWSR